jgi:hypothetical protein
METQYKLILAGYLFNWGLSIPLYGKYVRFDNLLGVWMIAYQLMVIGCLVSLGDVGWKHGILIAFGLLALLGSVIAFFSGKGEKLGARSFLTAVVIAPIWLWLLFS